MGIVVPNNTKLDKATAFALFKVRNWRNMEHGLIEEDQLVQMLKERTHKRLNILARITWFSFSQTRQNNFRGSWSKYFFTNSYQEVGKKTYHLRFCSSTELYCCFGGIYCLHLQVRRINQERNQQKQAAHSAELELPLVSCFLILRP
jgi:hypothetical protein